MLTANADKINSVKQNFVEMTFDGMKKIDLYFIMIFLH